MDHIIGSMKGSKYFSVIDLKSGYWQCPITERAASYLGMITPEGTFKWKVLPFGPKTGPAYFQRQMEQTLKNGLNNYCLVYIDDIVIYSDSYEEHLKHIDSVLTMLKARNWKCNYDKCHWALKQIKLLGKVLTGQGVITDPALIEDMVNFPHPRTIPQVQSFLGLMNVYRSFIKDHADVPVLSTSSHIQARRSCTL